MPEVTIHFVRHGEVFNPRHVLYERLPGFHLSKLGIRMVQETASHIIQDPGASAISAVFSSPLERTVETAEEILKVLNDHRESLGEPDLVLHTDARLIEAGNKFRGKRIGHAQGALWRRENLKLVRNLWKPTWGESYAHIAARMSDFVQEKISRYPDSQILVVSHESPIWSYRHMLETGRPEHNMLLRHTALASVTSITYDCETKRVLSITYADPACGTR
ncbi:MAG: histidine phosphatase family protein [Bifidobacterium sp.]|jgi:broad specificity phosphatase PhoE